MQAGVFGGICLLAFLLSEGRSEELDILKESKVVLDEDKAKENGGLRKNGDLEAPSDLKSELGLGVTQTNSRLNEGRSGDVSQSDARRDSAVSNAAVQSSGDGSAYAESFADSGQSRATAAAGRTLGSPFNPFNEELSPYIPPGSSFSQAEAQAINSDSYGQGLNSYPYPGSYPYSAGSNSPQELADKRIFQPSPNANPQSDGGNYQREPAYNPYDQGLSPGQVQNQADNGFYQPGYNGPPHLSPFNQGSSFAQVPSQSDRADAAQTYPDKKPAASGIGNAYSQGISPYANDYPSESPIRPGGSNPVQNEPQGPPDLFASGQSSPIAFEDAKSRAILPHEYVFPNKMPGGENVIQCTKENEFHHFWSQELACLVCICLNEYGLLQPVCASCGGCQIPPPKLPEVVPRLPESITVQPATPGPVEPVPIMPEPNPQQPIQEPYKPAPTPEPYPVYPTPEPATSPGPVTFPEPVATLPPPSETAHCSPLPNGVPFTNPLHPCQLCICKESLVSGKTDVQIECKENPQCIAPADVTALPPLPDVPMPIPLPICEKFPENVLFPHPTESCKLCKCSKSLSENGDSEQQITCYPHPDCIPKLEAVTELAVPPLPIPVDPYQVKPNPVPEPPPMEPLREPQQPMEPVPLPEVVTVEPLPWPPITTTTPVPALPEIPKPGPLPGPSPHESCRPYPPNQTFQHPWDECQVCVCTEATAIGMITVEVNCYTKPSCCIEPPDSVKTALPGFNLPYVSPSNTVSSPDVQALTSVSQPITSTYKPPPAYPSYSPKSVNIYPGSNQGADPLSQPPVPPYSGFVDPSSSYPYQPNYAPQYVNPQYPEYPPRLSVLPGSGNTIGQYKPNNFGYPANYQYPPGDANNYPPQGHYQPFDPRFQTVPAPSYPGMYQRAYERPTMYAPAHPHSYVKPPIPAIVGPSLGTGYATPMGYSKSGKDEHDSR